MATVFFLLSLFLLLLLSLQRINAVIIREGGGFWLFIVNKKYSMLVSSIESNLKGENIKAENE